MRQVVFVCPNTGRTTRSLMVEFETDPLDGIDAANCPECSRAHIVLRQTGKPPIRKEIREFAAAPAVSPLRDLDRRAS